MNHLGEIRLIHGDKTLKPIRLFHGTSTTSPDKIYDSLEGFDINYS